MSADHDDYAQEPIPGLPARPPSGEEILWQGSPSWKGLAIDVFHVRAVAIYFAVLIAWRAYGHVQAGASGYALLSGISLSVVAVGTVLILCLLARAYARTTVYTVTDRRVVIRSGVALPTAINLPFAAVTSADVKLKTHDRGDIRFVLSPDQRAGYVALWPHVRLGSLTQPEPMLRCIEGPADVVERLKRALERRVRVDVAGANTTVPGHTESVISL